MRFLLLLSDLEVVPDPYLSLNLYNFALAGIDQVIHVARIVYRVGCNPDTSDLRRDDLSTL